MCTCITYIYTDVQWFDSNCVKIKNIYIKIYKPSINTVRQNIQIDTVWNLFLLLYKGAIVGGVRGGKICCDEYGCNVCGQQF